MALMDMDDRLMDEFPFRGQFYEFVPADPDASLLEQTDKKRLVLDTVCDIQRRTIYNGAVYTTGYRVFYPLEPAAQADAEDEPPAKADGTVADDSADNGYEADPDSSLDLDADEETDGNTEGEGGDNGEVELPEKAPNTGKWQEHGSGKWWENIVVRRGMYFRGEMYGYIVDGEVQSVTASMLGGVEVMIDDRTEE